MIRFLIIGAALYLAGFLLRRLLRQLQKPAADDGQQPPGESTARCAYCGLFVPRSQAFQAGANFYCSREHQRAGPDSPAT